MQLVPLYNRDCFLDIVYTLLSKYGKQRKKQDLDEKAFLTLSLIDILKVLFYTEKAVCKNDKAPVMGHITINGTQAGFSCKKEVSFTLCDRCV